MPKLEKLRCSIKAWASKTTQETWQHPADKFEGLLRVYRQAFWTTVLVHGRDHIKKVRVYSLLGLSTHKNVNVTQLWQRVFMARHGSEILANKCHNQDLHTQVKPRTTAQPLHPTSPNRWPSSRTIKVHVRCFGPKVSISGLLQLIANTTKALWPLGWLYIRPGSTCHAAATSGRNRELQSATTGRGSFDRVNTEMIWFRDLPTVILCDHHDHAHPNETLDRKALTCPTPKFQPTSNPKTSQSSGDSDDDQHRNDENDEDGLVLHHPPPTSYLRSRWYTCNNEIIAVWVTMLMVT